MRLGKFLCASAVMALLGAVFCGGALAALTPAPNYSVSSSSELKNALESDNTFYGYKTIDASDGLHLFDNAEARYTNMLYIGGSIANRHNVSFTIDAGTVITMPATETSESISHLMITNGLGKDDTNATAATFNLRGDIVVEANGMLHFSSSSTAWNGSSFYSGDGGLTVSHTGTITVKSGGTLALPEANEDAHDKAIVWADESTGSFIFEEGAKLINLNLDETSEHYPFIDRGVRFEGKHELLDGGSSSFYVQPTDRAPSPAYITAGTYRYDAAQKAFVKGGSSNLPSPAPTTTPSTSPSPMPSPSADPNPSPSFNPKEGEFIPVIPNSPGTDIGTVSVDDGGGQIYINPPAGFSDATGRTYKWTVSLGLSYDEKDKDKAVTLLMTVPEGVNGKIEKGTSGFVAWIEKKDADGNLTGKFDGFDVTVGADNAISFTVKPVGDYFSEAEIIFTQRTGVNPSPAPSITPRPSSMPQPTKEPGGSSGGGGCSNGFGAIAVMALAVLAMRRKG